MFNVIMFLIGTGVAKAALNNMVMETFDRMLVKELEKKNEELERVKKK